MKRPIAICVAFACLWLGCISSLALTPKERELAQKVRTAVEAGIEHNKALQEAAEQARVEAASANSSAGSAWASAMSTELKAKSALEEAARCKKENDEMRPIVATVTGPWWFPGGKALLYGAKKSAVSALVIIIGAFVLFILIKIGIAVATGGTVSVGLGAVGRIFGKLGRWFGRVGKRLFAFFTRRGKTAIDNIEHRTIGSDPPDQ